MKNELCPFLPSLCVDEQCRQLGELAHGSALQGVHGLRGKRSYCLATRLHIGANNLRTPGQFFSQETEKVFLAPHKQMADHRSE